MKLKMINRLRLVFLSVFSIVVAASCTSVDATDDDFDDDTYDTAYDETEQLVFDEWMALYHPELIDSRQDEGFYVEILSEDKDLSYPATNGTSCWVYYNILSYDLEGNICNTRSESVAIQQGTFNLYTRYVPTNMYVGLVTNYDEDDDDYDYDDDDALTYALRNQELVIDGVSVAANFTVGSKFRLWMPSRLVSGTGDGTGGYAGQFSRTLGRPMVSEIEITSVIVNAEDHEKEVLDWFVDNQENPSDWEFVENIYADYIYINHNYTPNTTLNFISPYTYNQLDNASNFEELDALINEALIEAFGEGIVPTRDEDDIIDDDVVSVWYITRTLDGFVVDTNIEEVDHLVYNTWDRTSEDYGSPLSYSTASRDSYIDAFYYTIPLLEEGQWVTMVTSSLEAYDIDGSSGSATSTEINPYTSLIFQMYIED